jgi:hypothetical protein
LYISKYLKKKALYLRHRTELFLEYNHFRGISLRGL